jgi:serine/threonine protein kinase
MKSYKFLYIISLICYIIFFISSLNINYNDPDSYYYLSIAKHIIPSDHSILGDILSHFGLLSGKILFDPIKDSKYSRDYYHLCLINDTCNNYSQSFLKKTRYVDKFFKNNKLIDYNKSNEDRLLVKVNELNLNNDEKKEVYDILKLMLEIDNNKRINISDLLNHSFLRIP